MAKQLFDTQKQKDVAILAYLCTNNKENTDLVFAELNNLAKACDITTVGFLLQHKSVPDVATLIGAGKLEELKNLVDTQKANLVIFNNELSGSKLRNLEDYLGVKVIDRTMLILDIFARRAVSSEGKLQVELAQLKYTLPRLNGLSGSSGRFGASGVGMRGPGETKLELDKRAIENNIISKQNQLKKLGIERDLRRKARVQSKQKSVAIVGYTNSGKSTLLNTITKANVLEKDMLFATLDTTTRSVFLCFDKQFLLTDTIGFVSNLPHNLIEAFSSTLKETLYSDLLLIVLDVSNPNMQNEKEVVEQVLKDLKADSIPRIYVYNKIDLNSNFSINSDETFVTISAKKNIGIDVLKQKIEKMLF